MLATYIGRERTSWCRNNVIMLMANQEYNVSIEEESDHIDVLVFNKTGTKLKTIIYYQNYSSLREEWKLAEKNDALISQCLTTFS